MLCPGVVPKSKGQVEAPRKNGHQHHEAARLPHAVIQPRPYASQSGACGQPHATRSLAKLAHLKCHAHAQHPGLHGLTAGPAAYLFKP